MVLVRVAHVPIGGDQARHGPTGSKSSVALLKLGVGSCVKSCTLMPAARRVSRRSSGGCSMWLMSHAISVGAGGQGLG